MAFDGEVALITGGGSGMGRLAARNLAAAGKKVAALDVNETGLAGTREGLPSIRTCSCDVTSYEQVASVVEGVEAELGPIDRVYNAAGIMPTGRILEQPVETIHAIMQVNYGGVVNVTKATLPRLLERGRGDLIQFASLAGWIPTPGLGAYDASKFAVVAFSEVVYQENRKRGVRMCCVCPPPVATPLFHEAAPVATFKFAKPLTPQSVLDDIERALERGRFLCFPGASTRLQWWGRRFTPGVMWASIRKIEGLP